MTVWPLAQTEVTTGYYLGDVIYITGQLLLALQTFHYTSLTSNIPPPKGPSSYPEVKLHKICHRLVTLDFYIPVNILNEICVDWCAVLDVVFFPSTGNWSRGLAWSRQVIYHWATSLAFVTLFHILKLLNLQRDESIFEGSLQTSVGQRSGERLNGILFLEIFL